MDIGQQSVSLPKGAEIRCLHLLGRMNPAPNIIAHSLFVAGLVSRAAEKILQQGEPLDPGVAVNGALLHDIGRCVTNGIRHGIEGAAILRGLGEPESYALICERHIGAGISRSEAIALGLPPRDFMPLTLEEKLVAACDNITFNDRRVSIDQTITRFSRLASPAVLERMKLLHRQFESCLRP